MLNAAVCPAVRKIDRCCPGGHSRTFVLHVQELGEHSPMICRAAAQTLALLLVAAALPTTSATVRAQDIAAGANVFKKCLPCHAVGEDAKNKVGPQLNGIDGRPAGTAPGYSYSSANKNSGLVWDEAAFKEYIRNPRAKIPGTKMIFPGIKRENDIANLWAYLKQFDAAGKIK